MLNKLAEHILNNAKKLASSGKKSRVKWTAEMLQKNIDRYAGPTKPSQAMLFGIGSYGQLASMLHASYTKEYEQLFTDEQRDALAKKAALSVVFTLGGFALFLIFLLRISFS